MDEKVQIIGLPLIGLGVGLVASVYMPLPE